MTLEDVTRKKPEPSAEQAAAEELVRRAREQGLGVVLAVPGVYVVLVVGLGFAGEEVGVESLVGAEVGADLAGGAGLGLLGRERVPGLAGGERAGLVLVRAVHADSPR